MRLWITAFTVPLLHASRHIQRHHFVHQLWQSSDAPITFIRSETNIMDNIPTPSQLHVNVPMLYTYVSIIQHLFITVNAGNVRSIVLPQHARLTLCW